MKIDDISPEFIMLIGLPGSGKSTYIQTLIEKNPDKNYAILSSDDILTAWGEAEGLNYPESFRKFSKQADKTFKISVRQSLNDRKNIIIDKTSLTPKSRAKNLNQVPSDYKTKAIVFEVDPEELEHRLNKRAAETGKFIPPKVIEQMIQSYQRPTKSEFDEIKYV